MLVCFVVVDGVAGVDAADVVEHSTTLTRSPHTLTHTLSHSPPPSVMAVVRYVASRGTREDASARDESTRGCRTGVTPPLKSFPRWTRRLGDDEGGVWRNLADGWRRYPDILDIN